MKVKQEKRQTKKMVEVVTEEEVTLLELTPDEVKLLRVIFGGSLTTELRDMSMRSAVWNELPLKLRNDEQAYEKLREQFITKLPEWE